MYENVVIYGKKDCIFCVKIKTWMDTNLQEYKYVDLTDNDKRKKFYEKHNVNSVPQIFIDEDKIGGYSEWIEYTTKQKTGLLETSKYYKPFMYPHCVELTKLHERMHWTPEEIDLSEDMIDWKSDKITSEEKKFIENILKLFTQSDVSVAENYVEEFLPFIKNNEARGMLLSFASREFSAHQLSYALLNDTLGLDDKIYSEFMSYKEMADKVEFMQRRQPKTQRGLALNLAKSAFTEGLMLFASFCMLLNFGRRGLLKGMSSVNEYSIRDEAVHVEGNTYLFRCLCEEKPKIVDEEFKKEILDMAKETVKLEDHFIDLAYANYEIKGLTKEEVKQYVRHIADRRLLQLGLKPHFKVKDNPIPWIETMLSATSHANFFEKTVTDYSKGGLRGEWDFSFMEQNEQK